MKDTVTNDCVIRKNEELKSHYQKPNIVEEIRNKRLQCETWRNQNPLLHTIPKKNRLRKRLIEKLRIM